MTITSTTTKQTLLGDGLTRDWPFTFQAWENEIRVIIADASGVETDVTDRSLVLLEEDGSGGVVTHPVDPKKPALPAGHRLVIMRDMSLVQETRLVNVTRFDPKVIENQLDRLIANDQQLREQANRALTVGVASGRDPNVVINEVFEARDRAETAAGAAGQSRIAAAGSAEAAAQEAADASASSALARRWAENPRGVPVAQGEYSAKHWALEALESATEGPTASPTQKGMVPAGGTAGQFYRVNASGNAYRWEDLPEPEPPIVAVRDIFAGTIQAWPFPTIPLLADGLPLGLSLDGATADLRVYPRLARVLCSAADNAWMPAWFRCDAGGSRDSAGQYIKLDDWRGGTPRALDLGRGIDRSFALVTTTAGSSQIIITNNLSGGGTLAAADTGNEGFYPGVAVSGTGIPAGATIISAAGTSVTLSAPCTASGTKVLITLTGRVSGSWQNDAQRRMTGNTNSGVAFVGPSGVFSDGDTSPSVGSGGYGLRWLRFDSALQVPTAPVVRPAGPTAHYIILV